MSRAAALALLLLVPGLGGCALQPLYAGGSHGAVAQGLAAIDVPPIEGRAGWLMRNALNDRLGAGNSTAARVNAPTRESPHPCVITTIGPRASSPSIFRSWSLGQSIVVNSKEDSNKSSMKPLWSKMKWSFLSMKSIRLSEQDELSEPLTLPIS